MFLSAPKISKETWKNYAHELNSYFTEWISDLEVNTFEQLKDLMTTEQLKYRVPVEMREHFLHEWIEMKTPCDLAEKLDEYESIKQSFRREFPKKNCHKFQAGPYGGSKVKEALKDFRPKFQIKKEPVNEKYHEKEFEKRSFVATTVYLNHIFDHSVINLRRILRLLHLMKLLEMVPMTY
ncbi:hypothetical protein AVEN_213851-1 [Araneus ventricosus]|uniref:SCAN box domain-containing protein n=1 Tax=Araneus ventricosus TaxID=182803 RepID=A0A4Y2II55_ARAVE|nr:hypothetical protein AVEN_213851-1 [Araneus ventricosus]